MTDNNPYPKLASFPPPPSNPISTNPPPPIQNQEDSYPLTEEEQTTSEPKLQNPPPLPPLPPLPPTESPTDFDTNYNSDSGFNPPPLPEVSPAPDFQQKTPTPLSTSSIYDTSFANNYQSPTQNSSPTPPPTPDYTEPTENYFTDPVAPEIPSTPPYSTTPTPPPPTSPPEREYFQTPSQPETPPLPPTTPLTQQPILASPPSSGSSSKVFTFFLIILVIGAIAAGAAFFIQYQQNKTNLNNAESTVERQQLTPSPTEEVSIPEPTETSSQYPEITIIDEEKPQSVLQDTSNIPSAFNIIDQVLDLAFKKSPSAQLILITTNNLQQTNQREYKYWFRSSQTQKIYFYIQSENGKNPTLVENNVVVNPDNNIPSLNDNIKNQQLGLDLGEAITLAKNEVIDNTNFKNQTPTELKAKYVKTKIGTTINPMWELTYKFSEQNTPLVVQIDSLNKKIIFTNIKYTPPTSTPTTSPSPTPIL